MFFFRPGAPSIELEERSDIIGGNSHAQVIISQNRLRVFPRGVVGLALETSIVVPELSIVVGTDVDIGTCLARPLEDRRRASVNLALVPAVARPRVRIGGTVLARPAVRS